MGKMEVVTDRCLFGSFLERQEAANLTPAELTQRTSALAPMIAEYASEAERLRKPVDEVWAALQRSGYFYQLVPREFGGMATDLESFLDATLPIAEACASTGWTASFCAAHNRNIANYPIEIQQDLWAGDFPYVTAPQLTSPAGSITVEEITGGIRVSGSWDWAIGIMHADWIMAVATLPPSGPPPQMVMLLFPAREAKVLDTWHADGMAGTGSHQVQVENLFVPESHVLRDMGGMIGKGLAARLYTQPVYRAPAFSFAQVISSVVALGAARRALKIFREHMTERIPKGSSEQSEKPAAQIRLAEADVMIATAELLMRDAARNAGALGDLELEEQISKRIAGRAKGSYAVSLCRKAVLHLAEGAGSSVHMLDQPFQRVLRDVSMVSSHVAFDLDTSYELHGRSLLGLPPNHMMF